MTKLNKIFKSAVAVAGLAAMSGFSVMAQQLQDTTDLSLSVTAGQLNITAPASATLSAVTLASTDQTSTASITGITAEDFTGSGAGWTVTMKVSNLNDSSNAGAGSADNNILLGTGAADGASVAVTTPYLTIENWNPDDAAGEGTGATLAYPKDNTGGEGTSETDLALTLAPTYANVVDTGSDSSVYDNSAETDSMNVLAAEVNEGAGSYIFNSDLNFTIPAFANYGVAGKTITADTYTGTVTYDIA